MAALVVSLALGTATKVALAWTNVGTGIDYQYFYAAETNDHVFVTRMDRHNPECYIESSLAQNRDDGYTQTVSGQFNLYDDALSFWGQDWGRRYDVVAAINGDYWSGGIPLQGQVQGGWLIKPAGLYFGWTSSREPISAYASVYNNRVLYSTGVSQAIDGVNRARSTNELVVYTNHYGANTKTDNTGVEVLVEMMRPAGILPSTDPAKGIVRQILINQSSTQVPFDHVVLSATGSDATTLQNNVAVGQPVYLSASVGDGRHDWNRDFCAIGGMPLLITYPYDQPPQDEPTVTAEPMSDVVPMGGEFAPRTAVAYNDDYVFFVVVDGRCGTDGMDFAQVADFCRLTLGATNITGMDGGGSSCLVVNGTVMNVPSDGCGNERAVPNGLMMCVRNPKSQSTSFNVGDSVSTGANTTMRTGPGSNYLTVTSSSQTSNKTGTVLDHSLRGINAKGANWWRCTINTYTGWVPHSNLTRTANGNLPVFTQHPAEVTVCPTANTSFTVAATGTGTLLYQWQHFGVDLSNDGHYGGVTTTSLSITNINDLDAGSYRCLVTDNIGTVTSYSAALVLKNHTVIKQQPQAREAYPLGGLNTASFSVVATGEGTVTYQWQKGTTNLTNNGHYAGTTSPTLAISGIDSRDAGQYRCRVSALCETFYSNYATLTVYSTDLTGDSDADMDDYALLQNCLGTINPKLNAPDCAKADLNGDGQVNINDVSVYKNCQTGAQIALPPGC